MLTVVSQTLELCSLATEGTQEWGSLLLLKVESSTYSFVNMYTASVGRMTNSNSVISTNAYEPK